MREARADTVQAVVLALLLHVLLFGLVFLGLHWTRSAAPQAAGVPISADLVDANALSPAAQQALADMPEPLPEPEPEPAPEPVEEDVAPLPQPLPEPVPEDAEVEPQPAPQEQIPEPDVVDQDEARADAESELAAEREQEERRRQEQIELAERQKQEEAEQKRRLAREQREQELAKLRAEQERVQREAEEAQRKLDQIASARDRREAEPSTGSTASPPRGTPDGDSDLAARYAAALQEAIVRNWTRPDNVALGQRCRIYITQLPGGQVMNVEFDNSCPYDALGRRSVEAAVRRAEPLPYAGFESVFNRRLNLNFTAQDR
ncbi:MAG TPA: cell envelope integrity protein TolA [Candidatus Luteimonas excrementigallinarum]|nr:cell envelope integrity protein TolA [Candidatus Luteimonas excrementigallinarum]